MSNRRGSRSRIRAAAIHGITTEIAEAEGIDLSVVLKELLADVSRTGLLIGHNVSYDLDVITHECSREKIDSLNVQGEAKFLYDEESDELL